MIRSALAALVLALAAAPAAAQVIPTAAERHPGLTVEPLAVRAADGTRLRAIVTKPAGARGRLPAVLYLQPLSCDTVAIPAEPGDGWEAMLQILVRESGALVWRTEKRGVGGSEGGCDQLDYLTELADHRAALQALRARPDVDPRRIVVFGASMGSNLAPLLARDEDLAGVAVWGGGARTWAERTLAFERNRVELGPALAARNAEMTARFRFIDAWLIGGRSPKEIASADPALGAVWSRITGTSETGMYGRPLAFHHQAQAQDWPAAWRGVRAPVLAMFGAYDWFEDASGVELIGDIVNEDQPGQARVVILPGLDHHFSRYPDRKAAFLRRGGVVDARAAMAELLPWLNARFGGSS